MLGRLGRTAHLHQGSYRLLNCSNLNRTANTQLMFWWWRAGAAVAITQVVEAVRVDF